MIAVVIPTYRARATILQVLARIGPEVALVVVVDDCCPERTGDLVAQGCADPRVVMRRHETNQGVGGAFLSGMVECLDRGATIIVKVDADGQMAPELIPALVRPIELGQADYVKGNRFHFLSNVQTMPRRRIFGNLSLSFFTKLSSGYWNIMDPTNGFFALHAEIARLLRPEAIAKRFFFESDLLYHLGLTGAKVVDFPMKATYGDEESNLRISKVLLPFFAGNAKNFSKRIVYKYFVRDFSLASLELVAGLAMLVGGMFLGAYTWVSHFVDGTSAPTGTIMIVALLLLIGFQLCLAFLNYDISTTPRDVLYPLLSRSGNGDDHAQRDHHRADAEPHGQGLAEDEMAGDGNDDEAGRHEHVGLVQRH